MAESEGGGAEAVLVDIGCTSEDVQLRSKVSRPKDCEKLEAPRCSNTQVGVHDAGLDESRDASSAATSADSMPPTRTEMASAQRQREEDSQTEASTEPLCGWLIKNSSIGLLKNWRLMWFVFGEDTCRLYYYRQPQDFITQGEIDISNATFSYQVDKDRPGLFEIRSEGRVHSLDAQNGATKFYWLEQLQARRRRFSQKRTTICADRAEWTVKKPKPAGGLVGQTSDACASEEGQGHSTEVQGQVTGVEGQSLGGEGQESEVGDQVTQVQGQASDLHSALGRSGGPRTGWQPQWTLTQLKQDFRDALSSLRQTPQTSMPQSQTTTLSSPKSSQGEEWTMLDASDAGMSSGTAQAGVAMATTTPSGTAQTGVAMGTGTRPRGGLLSKVRGLSQRGRKSDPKDAKFGSASTSPSEPMPPPACVHCKQVERDLTQTKADLQQSESDVAALNQMVSLLQKEMAVMKQNFRTGEGNDSQQEVSPDNSRLEAEGLDADGLREMLRQRDKHVVELQHSVAQLTEEKATLHQEMKVQARELNSLKDQVQMFQEMLKAKDEAVMHLTNQVFSLEREGIEKENKTLPPGGKTTSTMKQPPVRSSMFFTDTVEIEQLQDEVAAFRQQNGFLNSEVLELNQLLQDNEQRNRAMVMKHSQLEAEYYRTKSRYLFLLKELEEPLRGGDESKHQTVSQLLKEAIEQEENPDPDNTKNWEFSTSSNQEYDRYGFQKTFIGEDDDLLTTRANQLKERSEAVDSRLKNVEETTSHYIRWENFLVGMSGKTFQRSKELKMLIRSGIPHDFRNRIWQGCVGLYVTNIRDKLGPQYYTDLVNRTATQKFNPAEKQISLDLRRTLPNNRYFEDELGDGVKKLRKVLLAYSLHNPVIGYCQGLNRLVAIALLFLTEEEAFWCLVAIVEHVLPQDYYSQTLLAAQVDQRVLKDLVQEKLPRLHVHMETHAVDLSLFTFNWFLTIFVDNVPPETFLRVWDTFLYEGNKVLFRFALAFLKHAEEEILQQTNSFTVNKYMRMIGEKMRDVRRISQIAFYEINPFSMRTIANRRQYHLQQVKAQLAELDALRSDVRSRRQDEDRYEDFSEDDLDD